MDFSSPRRGPHDSPDRSVDSDILGRVNRIDAIRDGFLAGAYAAAGATLAGATTPDSASFDQPVFCVLVGPGALHATPPLADLLAQVEAGGGVAAGGQLRGYLRWTVWPDRESPLAKLAVRLTGPAKVTVDLLLDCVPCEPFIWRAAQGGLLALARTDTDSVAGADTAVDLDECLVLNAPRSTALCDLIDAMGWPRPRAE
jgi:hypothetical protein